MRSRIMRAEFFTDDKITELSFAARILFAGLWCASDREGRFEWKPKQLKHQIFPADKVDMNALLDELIQQNLIRKYEIDGRWYGDIPHFLDYQSPNCRETGSKLPEYKVARACTLQHVQDCHDRKSTITITGTETITGTILEGGLGETKPDCSPNKPEHPRTIPELRLGEFFHCTEEAKTKFISEFGTACFDWYVTAFNGYKDAHKFKSPIAAIRNWRQRAEKERKDFYATPAGLSAFERRREREAAVLSRATARDERQGSVFEVLQITQKAGAK